MAGTVLEEARAGVATLTLNRPERRNAITPELMADLRAALEHAWGDDAVRVIRLRGAGRGFCAGYDIGWGSASMLEAEGDEPWDPIADYQTMSRFVEGFMALWRSPKPVVAQVHGFCVAGGTDLALCSDLLVIAADAKIGYPPARVWGSPTTSMWAHRLGPQRAKRLLFTGDCLSGAEALEWGLAIEAPPAAELDARADALVARIARMPLNQLQMMKLLVNQAIEQMGLSSTQLVGTLLDGAARHTPEGLRFTAAAMADVRSAVAERDAPFGDYGQERR
jgi:enoyl-CoA hydratase